MNDGTTVDVGGTDIEWQDLTPGQRRVLRIQWLLAEIDEQKLVEAEKSKKVEPGTYQFVVDCAKKIEAVRNNEETADSVPQVMLDRLEDTYRWTLPYSQLNLEQQAKVAEWCKRDGHTDMAEEITKEIAEKKAQGE